MNNSLLRLLIAITFVVLMSPVVKSQNFTMPSGDNRQQTLQGLYGLDMPGGGMRMPDKQYELSARIVADPGVNNHAFVVVEMTVSPGWHVYAVTQPKGALGMPTVITLADSPNYRMIGKFAPNVMHESEKNEFADLPDELHKGTVQWFAPIEVLEGSRENLAVDLTFKGQVCDDAMQIGCIPVNSNITAKFDAKDASGEIAKAKNLAATFDFAWSLDASMPTVQVNVVDAAPTPPTEGFALDKLEANEVSKVEGGIVQALLIAFLGGLILNIMPCVLPVISLKILSFFEQAGKSRKHAFMLNLWYSLGIISVFLVLALLSQALCTMFRYQFFSPILCCVIFAFVLTMLEVWEVRMPSFLGTGKSVELMRQEGGAGAFFKGVITTLLAIPCTAPFLAAALTWVEQEMISGNYGRVVLAYVTIGFGMASPYLVIGAFPELIRFLPKPGAWMDTFKKVMGFVLLTVIIWILYFMRLPMVVPTVAMLFAIWFACWYIGKLPITAKAGEHFKAWAISLVVVAIMFCFSYSDVSPFPNLTLQSAMQHKIDKENERFAMQREEELMQTLFGDRQNTGTNTMININVDMPMFATDDPVSNGNMPPNVNGENNVVMPVVVKHANHWRPFSVARLGASLNEGTPVIVDFTADWCATCKVLERTVLNSDAVIAKIEAKKTVTLQADWTDGSEEITQMLKQLGGEQIPVVAIFDPREPNKPIVLRGLFRAATLLEQLERLP